MAGRNAGAFLAALLLASVAGSQLAAQKVPIPVPAPRPKVGTAPPPAQTAFDAIPRPPAAIPNVPEPEVSRPAAAPVEPPPMPAPPPAQVARPAPPPEPKPAPLPPGPAAKPTPTPVAKPAPEHKPVPAVEPKPVPAAQSTQTARAPAPEAKPVPVLPAGRPGARPGETTAFDAKQRALVDKVNTYLSGIRTLVGNFVQVGPDGRKTEGDFYIQKPGKVRFEYDPPTPIDIIADGQSMVVRDRQLATQDLYPLSQTPLRFLLSDRLDLLRDTNLVGVFADDTFVSVVIEERQALVGTHRLMLMFSAKDLKLKQWTVTDPQGYDTTVAVYNLDTTKKPDPGMFKINYERMIQ
jgi:outer membrane lipoprotein-sorting protein